MDEFFFSYPLEDNIASASEILRNLTLYRTQKSTVIVSVLSEITKYDQSFSIYQLGKDSPTFSVSWDWFRDNCWDWSWKGPGINSSWKSLKRHKFIKESFCWNCIRWKWKGTKSQFQYSCWWTTSRNWLILYSEQSFKGEFSKAKEILYPYGPYNMDSILFIWFGP